MRSSYPEPLPITITTTVSTNTAQDYSKHGWFAIVPLLLPVATYVSDAISRTVLHAPRLANWGFDLLKMYDFMMCVQLTTAESLFSDFGTSIIIIDICPSSEANIMIQRSPFRFHSWPRLCSGLTDIDCHQSFNCWVVHPIHCLATHHNHFRCYVRSYIYLSTILSYLSASNITQLL